MHTHANNRRQIIRYITQSVCIGIFPFLALAAALGQSQPLDEGWQLLVDKDASFKIEDLSHTQAWRNARVGLSWNAQFPDLRDYMGVAWYRTTFAKPDTSDGRHVFLRFAALDYYGELYVNGKQIGIHEGGYTPFRFDVTEALQMGKNELVVRVVDPPMDEKENRARFPDMLYNEIPHGKQNWYVQTGGIWQPVTLKVCARNCIDRVQITAKTDGRVSIQVRLANRGRLAEPAATEVIVRNPKDGV